MMERPVAGAGHSPPQHQLWGEGMGLPGLAVRGYLICLQEVVSHPVMCPALSPPPRQNQPGPVCVAQGDQGLENQHDSEVPLTLSHLLPLPAQKGHRQAPVPHTLPLLSSLTGLEACRPWDPATCQIRGGILTRPSGFYLHVRI